MGKYIRKAKTSGEVALMDISQSSLGVRTRAKTLALQRLQKSASSSRSAPSAEVSYLQLRSRRLVKPPISALVDSRRLKQHQQKQSSCDNQRSPNPSEKLDPGSVFRVVHVSDSKVGRAKEDEFVIEDQNNESNKDLGVEASFGDNVLDIEGRDRSARESTPCSLIRDPDSARTPGSTTRPTNSESEARRVQNSTRRHIPTAHEMDEFFTVAEEEQQRQFVEKYNFDPVNDKPLPGRYEWEEVDP